MPWSGWARRRPRTTSPTPVAGAVAAEGESRRDGVSGRPSVMATVARATRKPASRVRPPRAPEAQLKHLSKHLASLRSRHPEPESNPTSPSPTWRSRRPKRRSRYRQERPSAAGAGVVAADGAAAARVGKHSRHPTQRRAAAETMHRRQPPIVHRPRLPPASSRNPVERNGMSHPNAAGRTADKRDPTRAGCRL